MVQRFLRVRFVILPLGNRGRRFRAGGIVDHSLRIADGIVQAGDRLAIGRRRRIIHRQIILCRSQCINFRVQRGCFIVRLGRGPGSQ